VVETLFAVSLVKFVLLSLEQFALIILNIGTQETDHLKTSYLKIGISIFYSLDVAFISRTALVKRALQT